MLLSHLDSNQDKQIQNLLCYHYTIGQFFRDAKVKKFVFWNKYFSAMIFR